MTEQLEAAWKASAKPFHAETIYTEEPVPLEVLQPFAKAIVGHLALYYRSNSLFTFDDWHAHDGFIVSATIVSLTELIERVASVDSLASWRHGDDYVYRAVYPDTLNFLLRINILDEHELEKPGLWGSISFTGYGFDIAEIGKLGAGIRAVKRDNSKSYFDRIYAG